MSKLDDVTRAASELSPEDRSKLRAWLEDLEERAFDDALEQDIEAGRLDWLKDEALANYQAGDCLPLKPSKN